MIWGLFFIVDALLHLWSSTCHRSSVSLKCNLGLLNWAP